MNHKERCDALETVFAELGFPYFHKAPRGPASHPSDCDTGYLFYRKPKMADRNYEMFRGYVHNDKDVVYLRVNVPGVERGLGRTPLELDPNDPDFVTRVSNFVKPVVMQQAAADRVMFEFRMRKDTTRETQKETCPTCKGSKKDVRLPQFRGEPRDCKVCYGRGYLLFVVERYRLSPYDHKEAYDAYEKKHAE